MCETDAVACLAREELPEELSCSLSHPSPANQRTKDSSPRATPELRLGHHVAAGAWGLLCRVVITSLPRNSGMTFNVNIKHWHAVASWTWDAGALRLGSL